jgi:signal transduction histidine kinase
MSKNGVLVLDSTMNPDLAAAILAQSGTAVFQSDAHGVLRAVSPMPAWLSHLMPDGADGLVALEKSPFLENFLIDAEAFWARENRDSEAGETAFNQARSGPWIETDADGLEHPLEASAVIADGQRVLLIERVHTNFVERVKVLQQARDQNLVLAQLGREIRALNSRSADLQRAIAGLEYTLKHAHASLLTVDQDGVIQFTTDDGFQDIGSQIVSRPAFEVFADYPQTLAHLQRAIHGETLEVEETIQDRVFELRYAPLLDTDGVRSGASRFAYDVTERETAEAVLVEAKLEAERASATKTEFVAHMSHELRTPLTSVIGFSEVLYYGMAGAVSDVQRQYLSHIQHSGEHLLALINDILDLSKIDGGALELRFEPVNVADLVGSSLRLVRNKADRSGIKLSCRIAASLRVHGDESKLRQVMLNLLSNAVKFTPERGRVTVRAKAIDKDFIEIAVTDTGPGISLEDQKRLFRPFSRVGRESDNQEGTGLGLVITRRLVELHGGTIEVSSELGRGSTFVVRLPRVRR